MDFITIPSRVTPIRATERTLELVYTAAKMGLKGDSLAVAAGLTPSAFRQLFANDPLVDVAILRAKADSELAHATKLHEASLAGDSKASLAILQHLHGWVSKQHVEVTNTSVSIKALLDARDERVKGIVYEHIGNAGTDTVTPAIAGDVSIPVEVCDVGVPLGGE